MTVEGGENGDWTEVRGALDVWLPATAHEHEHFRADKYREAEEVIVAALPELIAEVDRLTAQVENLDALASSLASAIGWDYRGEGWVEKATAYGEALRPLRDIAPMLRRVDAAFSHEAHDAERDALYDLYRTLERIEEARRTSPPTASSEPPRVGL